MSEGIDAHPIKELLEKVFPPETAEAAYRRGYRDGYLIAHNDMPNGSDPAEMREALERMHSHWHGPLFEWEKAGQAEGASRQLPPALPGPEEPK